MAQVTPITGIHYDPTRVNLEAVVGPPYDVISPAEQDALYASSPYNFVRIMLNRAEPGDGPDESYRRAASCLEEWLRLKVLVEDSRPAYYLYRQEFTNPNGGDRRSRTGVFCALKLEPYEAGVVLPHEETRLKAKEDRLKLMRSTLCNTEPIYALYEDPGLELLAKLDTAIGDASPILSVTVSGDDHVVWRLDNPEIVEAVERFFVDRRIWIADGHHRYETALAYAAERRAHITEKAPQPFDLLLVVLTAFEDPGIVVLPTHRLVRNVSNTRMDQFLTQLERFFFVEETDEGRLAERMSADPARGEHKFGVVTNAGSWVATLRDFSLMEAAVQDHSTVWKELDVSILQTLILDRSLGVPATSLATTPDIGYTRSWDEALETVARGDCQVALMLNDPSADEVRRVAGVGDKMPPKSTFFYPKLWSGLILRRV
jgi:uncharacterized protein (DUF1015 family)